MHAANGDIFRLRAFDSSGAVPAYESDDQPRDIDLMTSPNNSASDEGSCSRAALGKYYGHPSDLLAPLISPEALENRPGYFRLGEDIVCYGSLSGGESTVDPSDQMADSSMLVRTDGLGINLPFSPTEIIENLRRERYTAQFREEGSLFNELLRKAYYLIRPCLGVPVRRVLQKIHLQGWKDLRFPRWPVDTTVEDIHKQLLSVSLRESGLDRIPFIWFWPDGYSSCLIMTHDVEDEPGKEFCGQLMDLDESAGIHSSFQIVPENRYTVTGGFLDGIKSRGFEVNVHDLKHDGRLYAEHSEFLRRAKKINGYAKEFGARGFRSGILYRNADWYNAFEFEYDMSIPNVGHLDPQRGGCCTVMPYLIGNIVELPLTCTQDYTLFQILTDYSTDLWKEQIEIIRRNYGLISFIVHPDYVIEERSRAIYKELLDHLSDLRSTNTIWSTLPREVAAWWKQREEMTLTCKDGRWRVEGLGSERARVAIAILEGDNVVYEFAEL